MKWVIAGTRTYTDGEAIRDWMDLLGLNYKHDVVLCGGCQGPDLIGRDIASLWGIPVEMFYADWEKYGPSAGPRRNRRMAQEADSALVFWDGESKGTRNLIEEMRKLGKQVVVVMYV